MKVLPVFALALAALSTGCAWSGEEEEEPEKEASASSARLIGRVASIHEGPGFVLIEGYGRQAPGEGLLLSSVGEDGRTASLMASGERMGRFAAADLKSGEVRVGDLVFGRPLGTGVADEIPPTGQETSGAPALLDAPSN